MPPAGSVIEKRCCRFAIPAGTIRLMVSFGRLAAAVLFVLAGVAAQRAPGPDLTWLRVEGKSLTLKRGDEVAWTFHYGDERAKPCFHPLALPGGRVLTVDQPADHVWHYGLWFSWKYIDGVNYWENDSKTGRPVGRTTWKVTKLETKKDGSATIELDVSYAPPEGEAVLVEKRAIKVRRPSENGMFWIDWDATFTAQAKCKLDRTPLPGEPGGKPYGGYAGLSLRMAQLEERDALTNKGPVEWNKQNRFRGEARAFDYCGELAGEEVGVAIIDHKENPRSPTPWYAIRSSDMTFFSPAVLCRASHTMEKGETLRLRYRVIAHPGRLSLRLLGVAAAFFPRSRR